MPWPGNSLVMHSTVMGEKSSMMPPFEVTTFTIMSSDTPWFKPLNTQFPINLGVPARVGFREKTTRELCFVVVKV